MISQLSTVFIRSISYNYSFIGIDLIKHLNYFKTEKCEIISFVLSGVTILDRHSINFSLNSHTITYIGLLTSIACFKNLLRIHLKVNFEKCEKSPIAYVTILPIS